VCITNGGHFDEVFPKSYLESAAISQCKLYYLACNIHCFAEFDLTSDRLWLLLYACQISKLSHGLKSKCCKLSDCNDAECRLIIFLKLD
jgi:hypothetical protein